MELITITQLAKDKCVSRGTVYKWISQKKIDTENINGKDKIINNRKVHEIQARSDIQHTVKLNTEHLQVLEKIIEKQQIEMKQLVNDINDLKIQIANVDLYKVSNISSENKRKASDEIENARHVTVKTDDNKRKVSNVPKDNKFNEKELSSKERHDIICLINKALSKGLTKKLLDPKTRGKGINRLLKNPSGVRDKKFREVRKILTLNGFTNS